MKINKNIIKIGSRVRLKEPLDMHDCTYTKGHEFVVIGESCRRFDLRDDDGNQVTETVFIHHKLELIR